MNDFEQIKQMEQRLNLYRRLYAQVLSGADRALTDLEEGRVLAARQVLRQAMEDAEEEYLRWAEAQQSRL